MCAKFIVGGLLGLGMLVSQSAFAQSRTLTNSANVVASCSIATTQNLNFGSIDGLDFDSFSGQTQGVVNVKCTAGSYQVYLSNGRYPISGTGKSCLQRMKHPTDVSLLVYALNTDNTYNTVYPNSVGTCSSSAMNPEVYKTAMFTSSVRELNIPVYASIQKQYMKTNRFAPGNYSDTISVFIAF